MSMNSSRRCGRQLGFLCVCMVSMLNLTWGAEPAGVGSRIRIPVSATLVTDGATTRSVIAANVVLPAPRVAAAPGQDRKAAGEPRVILLLLEDGTLIATADPREGGPPYLQTRIDLAQLDALTQRLRAKGVSINNRVERRFGPDASTELVFLRDAKSMLYLQSWHELFERNSNLVVTSRGVAALNGRDREKVLAEDTAEYRAFRMAWTEIKTALRGLLPSQPIPPDGKLEIKLNWVWAVVK